MTSSEKYKPLAANNIAVLGLEKTVLVGGLLVGLGWILSGFTQSIVQTTPVTGCRLEPESSTGFPGDRDGLSGHRHRRTVVVCRVQDLIGSYRLFFYPTALLFLVLGVLAFIPLKPPSYHGDRS